jgi:S1-C subfamily serine protease
MVADEPFVLGGDIITAVNGNRLSTASQIARALMESQPGEVLHLAIYRQGQELEISIPLEKMQMQF